MSEQYEMVKALKDVISDKTLLTNLTVVENVDNEMQQIQLERQQEADDYGFNNNKDINETENDKTL